MASESDEYLSRWKRSLDNFAEQRVGRLSRKRWKEYICVREDGVTLWGKPPEALAEEIARYRKRPLLVRQVLSFFTSIEKKERLYWYYVNRQSFNRYWKALSESRRSEVLKISNQRRRGPRPMRRTSPPQKSSPPTLNVMKRFWLSIRPSASLTERESEQLRQYEFVLLTNWVNKLYQTHQKQLRAIYQDPKKTDETCIQQEQALFKERQRLFTESVQQCEKRYLSRCRASDKEKFQKEAWRFFTKAEQTLQKSFAQIALDATSRRGKLLSQRYLDRVIVSVPSEPLHTFVSSSSFLMRDKRLRLPDLAELKTELEKIKQKLSTVHSDEERKVLCRRVYLLTVEYIGDLSCYGAQRIREAKRYLYTEPPEGMLSVNATYQMMRDQVLQGYRLGAFLIHPDKAGDQVLFQKLGWFKAVHLKYLEITRINPTTEESVQLNVELKKVQEEWKEEWEEKKKEKNRRYEEKNRHYEQQLKEKDQKLEAIERKIKQTKENTAQLNERIKQRIKQMMEKQANFSKNVAREEVEAIEREINQLYREINQLQGKEKQDASSEEDSTQEEETKAFKPTFF